ncbi:MAG: D-2-hydroxyacid dehydrogenase [Peptococcaceae bacterium]
MFMITTAKISPKHLQPVFAEYPGLTLEYGNIEEVEPKLSQAEILISYGEDLTAELIKKCTKLKWLMVVSAGIDKLPFRQLIEQRVLVTNARGIHKNPMAEHAFALILQDSRRLVSLLDLQRDKVWDRMIRVNELTDAKIVIVGAGAIGTEVARKAKAFDMNTIGVNRTGSRAANFDKMYKTEQLHDALSIADYVVVITPLTPETRHMFGEKEFRMMPEKCYFINIARGEVVQEDALLKALTNGWIRGAALDTFCEEPLPAEHALWNVRDLIITPHLAGRTPRYMERAVEIFKHNLQVYSSGQGKMKNIIDLTRGY